ncbi:hypothetical protein FJTKL_15361 [Diaporthe vaccinii]|uniref:Uncharacterized protein n=1 Tax=Diaporthe vaccinii TaxID=105482 RepID=A0ABR4E5H7_9PEZI
MTEGRWGGRDGEGDHVMAEHTSGPRGSWMQWRLISAGCYFEWTRLPLAFPASLLLLFRTDPPALRAKPFTAQCPTSAMEILPYEARTRAKHQSFPYTPSEFCSGLVMDATLGRGPVRFGCCVTERLVLVASGVSCTAVQRVLVDRPTSTRF